MGTPMPRFRCEGPSLALRSPVPPIGFECETAHIMLRKSQGFSCSRSSYSRAMGRMAISAAWCVSCCIPLRPSDSSKSIMVVFSPFGSALDDGHAVEGREAARVAQPELHGMVADVAVTAEDLDGVVGDLERGLARIVPRQIALAGRRLSLVEPGRRLPGEQPHGVDLDRHVG